MSQSKLNLNLRSKSMC